MIRYSIVVFLFMSTNVLAQNDLSKLRSTFQQLQNEWSKDYIAGDANTLANMYTDDAYSLPDNTPMWKGRDNILAGNKKEMQSGVKYSGLTTKTLNVFGSGDIVYEIGTYSITFIPSNMTESVTDNGKYIDIWQKQVDGSWEIKADIWNSNFNPASTTQAGAKEKDMDDKKNGWR
jgi:uncharacterized protein (TIGR02246 family)